MAVKVCSPILLLMDGAVVFMAPVAVFSPGVEQHRGQRHPWLSREAPSHLSTERQSSYNWWTWTGWLGLCPRQCCFHITCQTLVSESVEGLLEVSLKYGGDPCSSE